MSFAYLPLFTGDYLRDTRHLTPLRHGVYLLALMHCWDSKGPMPLDEQECAGICNCRSADEVEAMRYIIGKFFVRMEDGHYNPRMQRVVEKSENISSARSEAGRRGYEAKAKHLPSKCQASASNPIPIPIPNPTKDIAPTALVAKGDSYSVPACPFQDLLAAYHELCPSLPKVRILTNMRQKHARARWIEVCASEKWSAAEGLEWFRWYFKTVESSPFLTGRRGGKDRVWRADFEWLMTPGNLAKVVEGRYKEAA